MENEKRNQKSQKKPEREIPRKTNTKRDGMHRNNRDHRKQQANNERNATNKTNNNINRNTRKYIKRTIQNNIILSCPYCNKETTTTIKNYVTAHNISIQQPVKIRCQKCKKKISLQNFKIKWE